MALGYDEALAYLRAKLAAFDQLGRVELPEYRRVITAVWNAASAAGDLDLEARSRAEFDNVTALQRDWELHNDTVQRVLAALRKVGVNLGVLPAAWVITAVIGLATGIGLMFVLKDDVEEAIIGIYEDAVRRGVMTPAEAAKELREYEKEQDSGISWAAALVAVAVIGGLVYFLPRPQRQAGA